jgi:hypothetical protein
MSRYVAIETRQDMFRWLVLAVLGLAALVEAGLLVHADGVLAWSVVLVLGVMGILMLGVGLAFAAQAALSRRR